MLAGTCAHTHDDWFTCVIYCTHENVSEKLLWKFSVNLEQCIIEGKLGKVVENFQNCRKLTSGIVIVWGLF